MATRISATELSRNLSDVLSRVQYRGEAFEIERNGAVVGVLRPPADDALTWQGLVELANQLRTGDPTFADDLERVQGEQEPAEVSPWPTS